MPGTVQFDIQFRRLAKEIQNVITHRMLPAEFVSVKTPVTHPTPHEFFSPGFPFPKSPGTTDIGHARVVSLIKKEIKLEFLPALTSILSPRRGGAFPRFLFL